MRSAPQRDAEAQVRTPTRSKPKTVPTGEMRLLRRVTDGATTEDVAWMRSLGYYGYLEWQLAPETMGDPDCERGWRLSRPSICPAVALHVAGYGRSRSAS